MDQRHEEYIEYYKARVKKYEGNPVYKNSLETENSLYKAIAEAGNLEEFKKTLLGNNLHIKNAIALVKDQETARKNHFEEIKESIRVKGPESILKEIDTLTDINSLTMRVNELNQKNSVEISIDLLTDYFYSDFVFMENLRVYEEAEIPEKWKKEYRENADEIIKENKKIWKEVVIPKSSEWKKNWKLDYSLIKEDRHRRNIPIPNDSLNKMIEKHKQILGDL